MSGALGRGFFWLTL